MSNKVAGIVIPPRTRLSRRDLLGFAAKGAASVIVSQSLLASCAAAATNATDTNGVAAVTTIYPGWYSGRAVHIHFKLRLFAGSTKTYEFTSQFFFDDSLTDSVYTQSPYSSRGSRDLRNTSDGIYNSLSTTDKAGLTLHTSKTTDGYAGVINLGVTVG